MVNPTVISTFAGCGGSSLGYKWAGFQELLAIDFDDNAVETFKLNFDIPIWKRDIKTVTSQEILDFCKIKVGELDVFDGSPPCQGFSTAGKREISDDRNDLFKEFVRLINELQPKVFVMENVSGQIKGKMKGFFKEIMQTLKSTEYNVKCKLTNAKYYEVPQARERLIYIGIRADLNKEPSYPEPLNQIINVKQAFEGLKDIEDRPMKSWMKQACEEIKAEHNSKDIGKIFIKYKGTSGSSISTKRLSYHKPANTIAKSEIAVSGLIHPEYHRYLNCDELKRLSTFPDDFKFTDRVECVKRIGNAVMPKFMYHIAKHIKENILQ